MSSQKTFQTILGKFKAGLDILLGLVNYNPNKTELKTAALQTQKTDAEQKNNLVATTGDALKELRDSRRKICFRIKDTNPNCLEALMRSIAKYLKSEIGAGSAVYKNVDSILKKIKPVHDKPEPPAEGEEPSPASSKSEKTFSAMVEYGNTIYASLQALGASYNPPNVNIGLANFKAVVDNLATLNTAVVNALDAYSNAVKARYEVYYGEVGIMPIMSSIKDYLESLEGGKNNAAYVSYTRAVK